MKRNGLRTLLTMIVTLAMVLSVAFSPALAGAEGTGDATGDGIGTTENNDELEPPDVDKWLTKDGEGGKKGNLVRDDDGSYTLNLSVTGKAKSTTEDPKVDVIFVLDVSGSMDEKTVTYTYEQYNGGWYGKVNGQYVPLSQDYRTGKLTYTDASDNTHDYFTSEGYHEDSEGKFGTTDGENYFELTIADDGTVILPDGSPYYNKSDDGSLGKVGDQYVQLYYYSSYYESYVKVQDSYYGSGILYYQKSDGTYVPYEYTESEDGTYGIVDGSAIELEKNSSGEWGYYTGWDWIWKTWHSYTGTRYKYSKGDRYTPGQRYSHHDKTGDRYTRTEQTNETDRLAAAKPAIKTAADAVLTGDTQVKLITFATKVENNSKWYKADDKTGFEGLVDGTKIPDPIDDAHSNLGTNWEAALGAANQAAKDSKDEGRHPYVVFVSDGAPTYYVGGGTGYDDETNVKTCYGAAKKFVDDTLSSNVDGLYCVNAFGEASRMRGLVTSDRYYLEVNADDINQKFAGIAAAINKDYTYKNVTITDMLSGDMVTGTSSREIADGYEIDETSFRYTVTDTKNNRNLLNNAESPDGTYVKNGATIREDGKSVTWSPMGADALVDAYKYTVSFKVKLTQKAYDEAAKHANTTSGASVYSVYSNSQAKGTDGKSVNNVTYDKYINTDPQGDTEKAELPNPTIPVPVSQITIKKHWNGGAPKPDSLTVNVKDDAYNKTTGSIFENGTKAVTLSGDTWTSTLYVAAGPDGHKYTATEVVPNGWKQTVPADNAGVTIDWPNKLDDQNGSAEFTNVPDTVTLTVRKNLTGDQADTTKSFKVEVTDKDGKVIPTDAANKDISNLTISDSNATDKKADEAQQQTITLHYGDTVTVAEGGVLGYSTTSEASDGTTGDKAITVTLNGDTTVTFNNAKKDTPITGITSGDHGTTTLLGILAAVGVAIAGGFALMQSRMSAETTGEHVGSRSWKLGLGRRSEPRHGGK